MWAAIGEFLAQIFGKLFKVALDEYQEPTETITTGFDEEIEDDIDAGIDEEFGFLDNEAHTEPKDQPDA